MSRSAVIVNHWAADSRTPMDVPGEIEHHHGQQGHQVPAEHLRPEVGAPWSSGVMRIWRVQPTCRSAAMRAPLEIIATMVPQAAMPVM